MNKYEKLIEYIISDDEKSARALFHEIVVSKSREIYESLLEDDDVIGGNPAQDLEDEITADEEMPVGDEEGHEDDEMGGEEFGDEEDEGDLEDRVMDLESALDELKAEFDSLMADEENEPEHHDGVEDPEFGDEEDLGDSDIDMDADEFGDDEEPVESVVKSEGDLMREYVEKVSAGHGAEKKGAGEGSEIGTGGAVSVNKKSTIDNMKNDMGGSNANIARGGDEGGMPSSPKEPSNAYTKGKGTLKGAERNVNQPGGNRGAQDWYNKKASAKKGEGQTTDSSVAVNDKSPLAK